MGCTLDAYVMFNCGTNCSIRRIGASVGEVVNLENAFLDPGYSAEVGTPCDCVRITI